MEVDRSVFFISLSRKSILFPTMTMHFEEIFDSLEIPYDPELVDFMNTDDDMYLSIEGPNTTDHPISISPGQIFPDIGSYNGRLSPPAPAPPSPNHDLIDANELILRSLGLQGILQTLDKHQNHVEDNREENILSQNPETGGQEIYRAVPNRYEWISTGKFDSEFMNLDRSNSSKKIKGKNDYPFALFVEIICQKYVTEKLEYLTDRISSLFPEESLNNVILLPIFRKDNNTDSLLFYTVTTAGYDDLDQIAHDLAPSSLHRLSLHLPEPLLNQFRCAKSKEEFLDARNHINNRVKREQKKRKRETKDSIPRAVANPQTQTFGSTNSSNKRANNIFLLYKSCLTYYFHLCHLVYFISDDDIQKLDQGRFPDSYDGIFFQEFTKHKTETYIHAVKDKMNFVPIVFDGKQYHKPTAGVLASLIALIWRSLSEDIKTGFKRFFETKEKPVHQLVYPNNRYNPHSEHKPKRESSNMVDITPLESSTNQLSNRMSKRSRTT